MTMCLWCRAVCQMAVVGRAGVGSWPQPQSINHCSIHHETRTWSTMDMWPAVHYWAPPSITGYMHASSSSSSSSRSRSHNSSSSSSAVQFTSVGLAVVVEVADMKHLAEASRHCDCSPERSVLRSAQSLWHLCHGRSGGSRWQVGQPLARLHSCKGRSPFLTLLQIQRIRFASPQSLATRPKKVALYRLY